MFCGKCGAENTEGITYCTNCGSDLASQTPSERKHTSGSSDTLDSSPTIHQPEIEADSFKAGSFFADRYEILSEGRKGGMGAVYKCKDTKLDEVVALKVIHPGLLSSKQATSRFRQEVALSRRLQHPNIVRVYNLEEWQDKEYFTMEWVEGVTLRDILSKLKKQNEPFSLEEAGNIMTQLSDALHYAHNYTVHRDIKPENILVESEKGTDIPSDLPNLKIKITDFGIAKMLSPSRFTMSSMQMGTPYYMAPEQKTDAGAVDKRADIYAAGVVLFELLTLENTIGLKLPTELNNTLPKEIDSVIKKALEPKPRDRYEDVKELSGALDKIVVPHKKQVEEERRKSEELKRQEVEKKKQAEEQRRKEAEEKERQELEKQKQEQERIRIEAEELKQREAREQEFREREEEARRKKIAKLVKRGNSILEYKGYDAAIKYFKDILEIDAEHKEGKKLLAKAQAEKSEAEKLKRQEIERNEQERIHREAEEKKRQETEQRKEKEEREKVLREREAEARRKKIAKLVKKGNSLQAYKDYDAAITNFKNILEIDVEHKEGKELLAKAQTEKSEAEKLKRQEIERNEKERIHREAEERKEKEEREKWQRERDEKEKRDKEAYDAQVRERKREREETKRKKREVYTEQKRGRRAKGPGKGVKIAILSTVAILCIIGIIVMTGSRKGTMKVRSVPPSAEIYINGDYKGVTHDTIPYIIDQIDPGKQRVTVKLDGYNDWSETVDVGSGEEVSLHAVLQISSGSIRVESVPEGAGIYLEGDYVKSKSASAIMIYNGSSRYYFDATPNTITDLGPGPYKVDVQKDGYRVWSEMVDVEAGEEVLLTAILEKQSGAISVSSVPPSARIYLDGNDKGIAPATLTDLEPGLHEVEVKKDGYEEWRETIDVGLGEEAVLNAVLRIRTGSIRVDSGPRGAKIYLDGNYKGATPKTLTGLEPGLHYVVFERDGYEVSKWEVQVEAGENKILKTKLQKLYGSMSVSSVPSSAMIYLDGNNKGVTPTTLTDLEPGLYKVEVKKEGYKDWSKTVDVGSGEEASLNAVLEIMTGSIRVESQPEGAQIYLDGNDKGTTPTTLTDLEPGLYKVEVKEAGVIENGYKEWKETVEVGPGEEVSLNAELLRKTGSIRVESVPRGAGLYLVGDLVKSEPLPEKIYADSSYYGTTPKTLTDLGPGSYKVAVKKGGYIDWVKKVYVEAGEETLLQVILQQQYGSISVSSAPASAKIYLDGNDKGITPATLTDLEPGSYKVEVKKEGYTDWSETVDVGSDKEVSLNAVLEIMTGSIRVKSEPIGAEIYLLDAEGEVLLRDTLRTTHNSLTDLKPGSYIVEVKKDGYEEWRETVDVGPGEDIPINVVLLKVKPLIVAKQSELWECNEFTFDATSSFDSDNMALSYHWDFGDGNVSDQPIATHRFKQGGDFNVILSVQDNSRLDCDSSVASHIVHVNTPPVADAGPNHVCCLGVVSDFDGSGSFDADGDNLSYSWDFGDGNTGEGVNTTHVYDEPGRYNGTLNVNDNSGTHCENSIVSFIAVLNAKPTSIIKFKETQTYNEFIFDATSSFDPNNQVINYHWDFGDGNVSDKPVVTHRFPWEGDYNVLLSVQDNSGLECDTAVSSQVVHVSTPPIANAEKIINLRSSYKNLSTSQVQSMSNISIREKDDYGFYGHSTIKHDYELKSSDGEKVVIDHATGLMWHQSGSVDTMEWNTIFGLNPKKWLKKLNRRGYAGYHDWRLPTVEEAASLLESSEKNGKLYIDPLFSDKQWYIWTGDKKNGSEAVWCVRFVRFDSGVSCNYLHSLSYDGFVRPVRSVTQ